MDATYRLQNIDRIAADLLTHGKAYLIFALHGDMGAGKTTLVHALGAALQVRDTVSSPTFSLVNEYTTSQGESVFHMDLYRLNSNEEAVRAGIEDALYSGQLCFVEWPEKAPALLPPATVHVYLTVLEDDQRRIRVQLPATTVPAGEINR